MDELKLCTCGGEPDIMFSDGLYYVSCDWCGRETERCYNVANAIKLWNNGVSHFVTDEDEDWQ